MEKTTATLIRRHRLTDTSLIVHWCSPEAGLIKTVAKGARQPRSPFAGQLDLFVQAEIVFTRSRTADLHALREVRVLDHRENIALIYRKVLAASYFVRLMEITTERETPIPEIHALLTRALDYLTDHDPTPKVIFRFELRLAEILGLPVDGPTTAIRAIYQVYHVIPPQRDALV